MQSREAIVTMSYTSMVLTFGFTNTLVVLHMEVIKSALTEV